MCGRFTQIRSREDYLASLADDEVTAIPFDAEPLGRYNVAPGTKVLLLSERDNRLHLDATHWGYAPGWWDKAPLINARVETAATSRMFRPLWQRGRAIVMADGWYEWTRNGNEKQPWYIYHKDHSPLFFAAIGSTPFERGDNDEGFVIVTSASDQGLLDIHDRRPLALRPDAARDWLRQTTTAKEASEIVTDGAIPAEAFMWHKVSKAVGNPRNQGAELTTPLSE